MAEEIGCYDQVMQSAVFLLPKSLLIYLILAYLVLGLRLWVFDAAR